MSATLPGDPEPLRAALQAWYGREGRAFPWREEADPFGILVLEVMSQQTQLARVQDAWEGFLERWPTPGALAEASAGEVIAFWSEHRLGYNRRAEYLHRAARHIVSTWDGTVPTDPDRLEELPGVGPYTSRAVASFAFDTPCAVVDTNVRRVIHRIAGAEDPPYERLAAALLDPECPGEWNNALMDLGATVCTPEPACDAAPCPWRAWCRAYRAGEFDAPETPAQSTFRGSRRQYRGRVVRTLAEQGPMDLDALGETIHEEYVPDGETGRDWLRSLLADLAEDGLVAVEPADSVVTLPDESEQA